MGSPLFWFHVNRRQIVTHKYLYFEWISSLIKTPIYVFRFYFCSVPPYSIFFYSFRLCIFFHFFIFIVGVVLCDWYNNIYIQFVCLLSLILITFSIISYIRFSIVHCTLFANATFLNFYLFSCFNSIMLLFFFYHHRLKLFFILVLVLCLLLWASFVAFF